MKALITSDWHIRSTVPSCVDATEAEWMDVQRKALDKVAEIADKWRVSGVWCGGDLFHSPQTSSFECVNMVQDFAEKLSSMGIRFFVLAGNHDLRWHSSSQLGKSAVGVILKSRNVFDMCDPSVQTEITGRHFDSDDYGTAKRIFRHVLVIPKEEVPFGCECETPESLLDKYIEAEWLFTGDYHKNFHFERNGRHVVNAGCLTKQASDFEGYTTGVYVVDFDTGECPFEPVNIAEKFVRNGKGESPVDAAAEAFAAGVGKASVSLDYASSLRKAAETRSEPVKAAVDSWIKEAGQ